MKISVLTPTIRGEEGLKRPKESLAKQTLKDFEWLVEEHDPSEPPDFNQAMNRMIKESKGELLVFLQDFISIDTRGLEKFWEAYTDYPQMFWTAPVGQTLNNKDIHWDWRLYRTPMDDCNFMEWEIDWGSAPRKAMFEIGGFDEELDRQWGFDNVNVGMRAVNAGYKVKCLNGNEAIALSHNEMMEHPYQGLRDSIFHNERLQDISHGLKVNYL